MNWVSETPLFTAADMGHLEELLKYTTKEGSSRKNRSGLDALHIAASEGHHAIVQVLLNHDPELSYTLGPSNATPLMSAATRGHISVVNELLSKASSLLEISRSNWKNTLHLAARQGHVEIVNALLDKDKQLARRTDKEGPECVAYGCKRGKL